MPSDATVSEITAEMAVIEQAGLAQYDTGQFQFTAYDKVPTTAPAYYPFSFHIAERGRFTTETFAGQEEQGGPISDGTQLEITEVSIVHLIGPRTANLEDLETEVDKWVRRYHTLYMANSQLNSKVMRVRLLEWEKTVFPINDVEHYGIWFTSIVISQPSLTVGA